MPISALKALIASRFGLGDGRTATFLITSVVDEPADRLATDAAVTTWLDSAMAVYSAYAGISVQAGAAAAAAPGAMAATYSAGPAAIPDKKVSAITTLQTLLALKLKRSIQNVPADATVKELVSGKSALQNELIGDIA
jgi:3-oxoacyl-ACP reductase-like protein